MKPCQVQSWARRQRRQSLHEFQRLQHDMDGAVFPRGFEFEYHLPLAVDTQVRDADRRSRDVAVQLFQPFAITRLAVHACMQREPVHLDA